MSFRINYIPLSFINTNEEIIKQIKNSVLFSFLLINNEETTLSHYLESTQYGYTASAQPTGSHKLVRITDIRDGEVDWSNVPYCDCDKEEKYLLTPNDILVARTGGTTGKSFFVDNAPDNAVFASYLIRLRLKKGVDVDFINAFLNSYVFWSQIVEMKSGSAMPNVNAEKLKTLRLPKCDSNIQKEVSKAFKSNSTNPEFLNLFENIKLIENYHKDKISFELELTHQLSLVKQLRQAFLREAMQGKLTSEWRASHPELVEGSHSATELLAKIKAEKEQLIKEKKIREGKLQEAETLEELLFEIPEDWVWCKLDEICKNITDGTHQTPTYTKEGRMFLSAQNVKPFKFMPEKHKFVSEEAYQAYIKNRKPEKGDLLIGRVGAGIGETAVIDQDLDFAIYVSLALVQPFKEHLSSNFLAYFFNSPYGYNYAKGNISSKGGSAGNFNLGRIRSFLVALPPLSEQKRIVAKLDELMAYCDSLEESIKNSQTQNELLLGQVLREALEPDSDKSTTGKPEEKEVVV